MLEQPETVLSVEGLSVDFLSADGRFSAVSDLTFAVRKGETVGIVGESGSGKSMTALAITRLIRAATVSGTIEFGKIDLNKVSDRHLREIRGRRIGMVFQDPMTSLNPYRSVVTQLAEVTRLHLGHSRPYAAREAVNLLERVGIPDAARRAHDYPHEFSGGMRQRVMIAMAISCGPELLIADEPTTALDVTIQAQILELIKDLCRSTDMSVILITHDLGVVAGMTDRMIVMYAGQIFERAPTQSLFAAPANPYTLGLLASVPDASLAGGELKSIPACRPTPAKDQTVARLHPDAFAPRNSVSSKRHRSSPLPSIINRDAILPSKSLPRLRAVI